MVTISQVLDNIRDKDYYKSHDEITDQNKKDLIQRWFYSECISQKRILFQSEFLFSEKAYAFFIGNIFWWTYNTDKLISFTLVLLDKKVFNTLMLSLKNAGYTKHSRDAHFFTKMNI